MCEGTYIFHYFCNALLSFLSIREARSAHQLRVDGCVCSQATENTSSTLQSLSPASFYSPPVSNPSWKSVFLHYRCACRFVWGFFLFYLQYLLSVCEYSMIT